MSVVESHMFESSTNKGPTVIIKVFIFICVFFYIYKTCILICKRRRYLKTWNYILSIKLFFIFALVHCLANRPQKCCFIISKFASELFILLGVIFPRLFYLRGKPSKHRWSRSNCLTFGMISPWTLFSNRLLFYQFSCRLFNFSQLILRSHYNPNRYWNHPEIGTDKGVCFH